MNKNKIDSEIKKLIYIFFKNKKLIFIFLIDKKTIISDEKYQLNCKNNSLAKIKIFKHKISTKLSKLITKKKYNVKSKMSYT